jgi:uncharacterized BrkB/YihY/UPF0761 family membrane protein
MVAAVTRAAHDRIEVLRARHDLVDAALHAADHDRRRAGALLAGGIAFRMFVWLLPAALFTTGIAGLVHTFSPKSPEGIAQSSGLGGVVANTVASASVQSQRATVALIVIGAVLTVSAAMTLVRALRLAFAFAWGLPRARRPGILLDAALFSIGMITVMSLSGVASWARSISTIGGLVIGIIVPIVGAALWLGISWRLPHGDVPWTALLPGTLLVYAGMQAMHLLTVYYFSAQLAQAGRLYGSLGVAATLLVWLYLVARLMVGGAFLNATLWYRKHPQARPLEAAAAEA